jgi:hypothetical protein
VHGSGKKNTDNTASRSTDGVGYIAIVASSGTEYHKRQKGTIDWVLNTRPSDY